VNHKKLMNQKHLKDNVKERYCENVLMKKFEEEVKKPYVLEETQYEEELHSLVKVMNDFGVDEKLYFMPDCCKETLLNLANTNS